MAKQVEDESKVMDVAKPGKGKIVGTSRPVVAPIVSTEKSVKSTDEPAPSAKKVIQPISDDLEAGGESADSEQAVPVSVNSPNITEPDDGKAAADTKDASEGDKSDAEAGSESNQDLSSDSASVDALAATAQSKKENAKKAEEQAKADAELEGLVSSKKYFVRIGKGSNKSKKKPAVLILVIIALLAAAGAAYYFVVLQTPSDDKQAQTASQAGTGKQSNIDSSESDAAEKQDSQSKAGENDAERKTELKNLQQRLETYFGDNDEYPSNLNELSPAPTDDELTGPNSDAYIYTSSSDQQSYVLSASLENKKDPDADSGGNYVLNSVNQ